MNAIELANEYRETMDAEVLRAWAKDAVAMLRVQHEALAPFVCGEVLSGEIDEASIPDDAGGSLVVKMGDIRRARLAYEAKP